MTIETSIQVGESTARTGETSHVDAPAGIQKVIDKPHLVEGFVFQRKNPFTGGTEDIKLLEVIGDKVKIRVTSSKVGPRESTIDKDTYEDMFEKTK